MKNQLKDLIQTAFPSAGVEISDENSKGFWINIDNAGKKATVQYHERKGFGVSDMTDKVGYGEGHDLITERIEEVVGLLEMIFQNTKPA